MYDYLIVGAGLFGSVFAYEATKKGKTCLVVDKRKHIGGNVYTENIKGINVHKYGAHIFHTSNKMIWDYIQQFATFNRYTNSPIAIYKDEVYNLPFNMNTFYQTASRSRTQKKRCTRPPCSLLQRENCRFSLTGLVRLRVLGREAVLRLGAGVELPL